MLRILSAKKNHPPSLSQAPTGTEGDLESAPQPSDGAAELSTSAIASELEVLKCTSSPRPPQAAHELEAMDSGVAAEDEEFSLLGEPALQGISLKTKAQLQLTSEQPLFFPVTSPTTTTILVCPYHHHVRQ